MKKRGKVKYGVILFYSAQGAIKAEKVLKGAGLTVKLIPVPRHLSSDCGVCLRFEYGQRTEVEAALAAARVPINAFHPI